MPEQTSEVLKTSEVSHLGAVLIQSHETGTDGG
jgi:hypothetical protein